jgi:hypothetical protein
MRRKLFTLAAGVSAGLCAAVCVLWVCGGSGWYSERWPDAEHRYRREYTLRFAGGHFVLIRVDNDVHLGFAAEISSRIRCRGRGTVGCLISGHEDARRR